MAPVADLRDKAATIALGGNAASREGHVPDDPHRTLHGDRHRRGILRCGRRLAARGDGRRGYRIRPAPARESYLRGDVILDVCRRSGAQAVHPGYGSLSENAAFAGACDAAGVVFVGPPASAIRAMGGKALMAAAGVPVVPGYHGAAQDEATLATEAARIGFPVGAWGDMSIQARLQPGGVVMDGVARRLGVVVDAGSVTVTDRGVHHGFAVIDPCAPPAAALGAGGRVTAPILRRVVSVAVAVGEMVTRGQTLVVLEAMKMEITLTAPADGVVAMLHCTAGDMVGEGRELVEFSSPQV